MISPLKLEKKCCFFKRRFGERLSLNLPIKSNNTACAPDSVVEAVERWCLQEVFRCAPDRQIYQTSNNRLLRMAVIRGELVPMACWQAPLISEWLPFSMMEKLNKLARVSHTDYCGLRLKLNRLQGRQEHRLLWI